MVGEWRFGDGFPGGQQGLPTPLALTGTGSLVNHSDINGTAGDDLLRPGDGSDTVQGGGGQDTISYQDVAKAVTVDLSTQQATAVGFTDVVTDVEHVIGSSANDVIIGSATGNRLQGGTGNDTINGGAGDDTLLGGGGNDVLQGGSGAGDRALFGVAYATATKSIASDGFLYIGSQEGLDRIGADVEILQFSDRVVTRAEAVGDATHPAIIGTDASELIDGTTAAEVIDGRGGWDWISSFGGSDSIDGGEGRDMVSFFNLPDIPGRSGGEYRLDIDLEAGTAISHDGAERITLGNIERVTGTIFSDQIRGDASANEIRGLGDYDWIIATTGGDTVDGGTGQDMISFVEYESGGANVVADIFGANGLPPSGAEASGVLVDLANPENNSRLAEGLSLVSVERVTGSSRQDVFYGDAGQNDFRGLGDYDWFVSSSGGRERYFGGDGLDTVTYFNADAGVTASLRNGATVQGRETGYGSGGVAARDLYFEIENLVGSRFGDSLTGSNERNQLSGLEGDDIIFGYGGVDYMKGGLGDDTLNGGGSSDYALFDGAQADYVLTRGTGAASNTVSVVGADGSDSLIDVEYFRFDDGDVTIWSL